jgi:CheY-like chemotaxis protein
MATILLIGEDDFLLQTRAAVLRRTGAESVCCDVASALLVLEHQVFDLVLLCHSIPGHLCETISEIIRHNWPGTRLLHISAVRESEHFDPTDGVEVCSAEPERLIQRTVELLGRRKPGSVRSILGRQASRFAARD